MSTLIFGDKELIRQIDPFRKLLDEGMELPPDIVGCDKCDGKLQIEFDDTWIEGDEFGAGTIRWYCPQHGFGDYQYQDDVMRDEGKIVAWIRKQYPTFKHEC